MARTVREGFSQFWSEIVEGMRERMDARLDEAAFEERIIGIENATAALKEAGVEDEKIIAMLQKYWDLRLSEAKEFLRRAMYIEED